MLPRFIFAMTTTIILANLAAAQTLEDETRTPDLDTSVMEFESEPSPNIPPESDPVFTETDPVLTESDPVFPELYSTTRGRAINGFIYVPREAPKPLNFIGDNPL
ncbi:hypothetical protein PVW53_21600 [Seohaeicola sp. SP36]|uniref:hypothetical protein n=1 Tax=unclassified Seohaeicola TaxID=2641111 RepID=UPI00237A22E3|nr:MULTISPECIES: hypothetical protein [unclassified Seohaeicola]MDD9709833.1 hypothetical protein [Seohaeicola sp. 4SK31]MDD9738091.1 hypothetical protein [Seohaeicola sp. SP36]